MKKLNIWMHCGNENVWGIQYVNKLSFKQMPKRYSGDKICFILFILNIITSESLDFGEKCDLHP